MGIIVEESAKSNMSDITPQYPDSYSQEDIQQILNIAIARHHTDEELSREQLWEIAGEMDISNAIIQSAEKDWLEKKVVDRQRRAFDVHRRHILKQKLTKFVIINTFLLSLNFMAIGALSWSLYILLFWGLKMSLMTWKAYQSQGDAYEKAFQRWSFQNEVKQTMTTVWSRLQKAWQA